MSKIAQIREACMIVEDFKKAGILFVPIPVISKADHAKLKMKLAVRVLQLSEGTQHDN